MTINKNFFLSGAISTAFIETAGLLNHFCSSRFRLSIGCNRWQKSKNYLKIHLNYTIVLLVAWLPGLPSFPFVNNKINFQFILGTTINKKVNNIAFYFIHIKEYFPYIPRYLINILSLINLIANA